MHGTCDPEAEPQQYKIKKDQNPGYEYNCPICKTHMPLPSAKSGCKATLLLLCYSYWEVYQNIILIGFIAAFDDDNAASTSQDSSFGDENSQQEQDPLAIEPKVSTAASVFCFIYIFKRSCFFFFILA